VSRIIPMWVLVYVSSQGEKAICEVDGGVCYEAYTTVQEAEGRCIQVNAQSQLDGQTGFYEVGRAPAGLPCFLHTGKWDEEGSTVIAC
jgi:hypothetical protein